MANSVNPDQTAPIGAVCFGSTLFASILNSSVMLGNYYQQTTFSDAFFLGALKVSTAYTISLGYNRCVLFNSGEGNKMCSSECQQDQYEFGGRDPRGEGGTQIFSYIRRLGSFFVVQSFEFQYLFIYFFIFFWGGGGFRKMIIIVV